MLMGAGRVREREEGRIGRRGERGAYLVASDLLGHVVEGLDYS